MAQSGGESNHTQTWDELAAHSHSYTKSSGGSTAGGAQAADFASSQSTGTTGTSTPFNVLDPYLTTWYIIRY